MQNIVRFFTKIGSLLLFILLEGVALYLLFTSNNYHQSQFFTTATQLSGVVYELKESVSGFFYLKGANEALMLENNRLHKELYTMKRALGVFTDTANIPLLREKLPDEFELIPALVIRNSVTQQRNFIFLKGGRLEGIEPEMGVANADGIVGVVSHVSDHYSVVIPVLCPPNRFSVKLKSSNTTGSLVWDGEDRRFAMMEEVPPYVSVAKGDTVMTSGYSAIFPEGIMVGTVEEFDVSEDANYLTLKIRLAVRFDALSNVRVIRFNARKELNQLKEETEE